MKKLLALFLIAVMCLPLAACSDSGNNSEKAKEYVGKWMLYNQEGYVLEILEDGTAKSHSPDEVSELRWSYNSDMQGILIAASGATTYFVQIDTIEDCRFVLMDGSALYHEDDVDKAESAEHIRRKQVVEKRFATFTESELDKTHTLLKGVNIKVKEFYREKDKLAIRVEVTNVSPDVISLASIDYYSGFVYNRTSHVTRHSSASMNALALNPGDTKEHTMKVEYLAEDIEIQYALFGFTFNEEKISFDITDFVQ